MLAVIAKKKNSPAGHVICVPPFGRAAGVFNPIWRSRGDKLSLEEVEIWPRGFDHQKNGFFWWDIT